jgi:hypothetical protein
MLVITVHALNEFPVGVAYRACLKGSMEQTNNLTSSSVSHSFQTSRLHGLRRVQNVSLC